MDRDELIERLKGYEWNDIEFKEARQAVPRNAYETVSAFSNTEGGWLVFGVRHGAGGLRDRRCFGGRQSSEASFLRLCCKPDRS